MDATWKALAEPVRREIVDLLRSKPRTTGELCNAFGHLSRFGVMNHIGVLKDAGFIRVEKQGRERINHLDPEPLREAYEDWIRQYEVLWAGRLGRLKREAERRQRGKDMSEAQWVGAPLASLHIKQQVDIEASPAAVFEALTDGVGNWWGAPYLMTGDDAQDVTVDARPGGLFQEVTAAGDGHVWCTVEQVRQDKSLVLNGRMGMPDAVAGIVRFELEDIPGGTRLMLDHRAVGQLTAETEKDFNQGWQDLLAGRLKAFIERGEVRGVRGG